MVVGGPKEDQEEEGVGEEGKKCERGSRKGMGMGDFLSPGVAPIRLATARKRRRRRTLVAHHDEDASLRAPA